MSSVSGRRQTSFERAPHRASTSGPADDAVGRVIRRSAVGLDVVAEVVVGVPPPRARERHTTPRRCVNSFLAGAGAKPPRFLSRLDLDQHGVAPHLGARQLAEYHDWNATASDRVSGGIDDILHAVR